MKPLTLGDLLRAKEEAAPKRRGPKPRPQFKPRPAPPPEPAPAPVEPALPTPEPVEPEPVESALPTPEPTPEPRGDVSHPLKTKKKPQPRVSVEEPPPEPAQEAPCELSYEPPCYQFDPSSDPMVELAQRELCRRKMLPFVQRFRPKYQAGWVHEDICRRLERFVEDVEKGLSPRLLLMMPVRHGKSELCSRHFPAWALGKHPDWEIIAASGAQNLALSFSRYARDLVRDPGYSAIFPDTVLDGSSQSAENWNIVKGGGYLAAGIGSMITGRGATILIVDDPVRDAQAADSATIRDNVWEWYMSTAYTRLAPGGGVLGILTWWNEDDWAGRIQQVMATGDGDMFEIVKYPAINDQGDEYLLPDDTIEQLPPTVPPPEGSRLLRPLNTALHEVRYPLPELLKKKANYVALGQKRWWDALFQQNPTPEDGDYFTPEMFRYYSTAPDRRDLHIYQAWDFAIKTEQRNDYTVGITIGVDHRGSIYVLDVCRFKSSDGIVISNIIVDYAQQHDPVMIGFEDGQIWSTLEAQFARSCDEKRCHPSYEVLKPLTDKLVRASPLRGQMQAQRVYFDKNAHWFSELYREFLRFNAGGVHDDQVDSCFIAGTQVVMGDGSTRSIDEVCVGDCVHTPVGPKKVTHAWCTSADAEVFELEFSDGRVIVGTKEHPFSTERGWVSLSNLRLSDRVHVIASQNAWRSSWHEFTLKQPPTLIALSLMGRFIDAILTRLASTSSAIIRALAGEDSCIATCGKRITALFRQGIKSIIRTETTSITTSQILNVSARHSIAKSTKAPPENTVDQQSNLSTLIQFVRKRLPGTNPLRVLLGTASMVKKAGRGESPSHLFVNAAETLSSPFELTHSSVGSPAKINIGEQPTLSMRRRNVLEQRHAVFNLSVEDVECYYANGLLVHNCAWAVRLTLSRSAPRQRDMAPKMKSWKDSLPGLCGENGASHMAA